MKDKKGFTLIELLAIIVILAIIAVITTPIILNIIENSKKGAAQDSALGYKDAVHKYYVSRLSLDSSFQMVDGTYEILGNGYLFYEDSSSSSNNITYEIEISGKIPSNGYVQIEKNIVKNACIAYDNYAVLISDGSISDTAKGKCTSVNEIGSISGSVGVGTEYVFPYVSDSDDKEQTFTATYTGYYKLEVWGASGGSASGTSTGGYGGYSSGYVYLTAGSTLYVNVGGSGSVAGASSTFTAGGYNGGGSANYSAGTGGGATHIAFEHGVLSQLNVSDLLIAASGGGGAGAFGTISGGSGGGITGNRGTHYSNDYPGGGNGGTQSAGGSMGSGSTSGTAGSYGQGGNGGYEGGYSNGSGAGGGGFYGGGGGSARNGGGGGGSGYIGNESLYSGIMYCYGCQEDGAAAVKTVSTINSTNTSACPNGYSNGAISKCAKGEDGYAKITYVGSQYSSDVTIGTQFAFPYVNSSDDKEQSLSIAKSGYYKLEVWGAQGGNASYYSGGYGGYSTGVVYLSRGTTLYINVGGKGVGTSGAQNVTAPGGYNGGGNGTNSPWNADAYAGSGGGATHIALVHGVLSDLEDYKGEYDSDAGTYRSDNILIVAGGGGGYWFKVSPWKTKDVGHAGGFYAMTATSENNTYAIGGGQTTGSSFGHGQDIDNTENPGGGGGWYGGITNHLCGAGGSGYVGSSRLLDGVMYCYGCDESGGDGIKTISTTGNNKDSVSCPNGYSNSALSNCAKLDNGYAKVTYLGSQYSSPEISTGTKYNFSYISQEDNKEQVLTVPKNGYYKLEVWGAQGGDGDSSHKGGYGGYSSGSVYLTAGTKLYVNVGGKGITNPTEGVTVSGGYNGGGENTASQWGTGSSGGGATHIALSHGTLASFDTNENGVADSNEIGNILIVAGGGGGSGVENGGGRYVLGGAAGGFKGNSSSIEDYEHIYSIVSGATQSTGYAFGQGGPTSSWTGGGGGGFYGGLGKTSTYFGGSGGSGYIGYSNLNNGVMYCYNCEENSDAGTRTISTTGSNKDSVNCSDSYSSNPLSNCAKAGNGYAVITYIGESLN